MDEQTISAQARLEQIEAERKELKEKVKSEREIQLAEAKEMRLGRDDKIEKIQLKLKEIQRKIYSYNKLGKIAKVKLDVLKEIGSFIEIKNN